MMEFCICNGADTEHCPFHDPKNIKRKLFTELLHAAYEAQQAQQSTHDKTLGRMIGELDWVCEIHRVAAEAGMKSFGVVTPWDEWALEHCGMTAKEMIAKYPELFKDASHIPQL